MPPVPDATRVMNPLFTLDRASSRVGNAVSNPGKVFSSLVTTRCDDEFLIYFLSLLQLAHARSSSQRLGSYWLVVLARG